MARFGATPEAWLHFSETLGLTEHLLPIVANPNAVIAQRSTMRTIGKTPSVYDGHREAVGLGKWTQRTATRDDVARWSKEPDYALCIQSRAVRAIDIDVPDPALADAIESGVGSALAGIALPKRFRRNSGKRLLAFRFDGPFPKRVVPVEGGIVEILGDGQQFVASGNHDSGAPYLWDTSTGYPGDIPLLTEAEVDAVWSTLCMIFATGEPKIAREKRENAQTFTFDRPVRDELAEWLVAEWDVYDTGGDGQVYLRCPFSDEHSTDGNETSTAYFPRGTGGYERGHWKCLHAHCMGREDHDFTTATGYHAAGFSAIVTPADTDHRPMRIATAIDPRTGLRLQGDFDQGEALPALRRTGSTIDATADNLNKILLRPDFTMMHIAWDDFLSDMMWHPDGEDGAWRRFVDDDYTRLRIMLERRNVAPVGREMLRDAVSFAGGINQIDSAKTWLSSLRWDGVERVPTFMARYLGAMPTAYNDAISRYIWTALAGRVLSPGCQADMAPIFFGVQGTRKSTAIAAISPVESWYAKIDLSERDDNLSRKIRGKLVGELDELRGLRSRDAEGIKSWVTRRKEEWTPKFKEFNTEYARRMILLGSTNRDDFLDDETGERRWLPTTTGIHRAIDVDGIVEMRDQLWAEGAARYLIDGVDWQDAERLARGEHGAFKARDEWEGPIAAWLDEVNVVGLAERQVALRDGGLSASEIARFALGIAPAQQDQRTKMRVGKAMTALGYVSHQVGTSRQRKWFAR